MLDTVLIQVVESDSWLHHSIAELVIDLENLIHSVKIEGNGAAQAGSRSAITRPRMMSADCLCVRLETPLNALTRGFYPWKRSTEAACTCLQRR